MTDADNKEVTESHSQPKTEGEETHKASTEVISEPEKGDDGPENPDKETTQQSDQVDEVSQ